MNYKEKLKLAKEALDSGSYDKETIEYIFPELRESEDERIRKEILQLVSISGNGNQFEEIKDWLEKQGEQKRTPKYKIGDCIKYRGEKYEITNVTVTDNNFYYNVSLIEEPSDWGEVVAEIGMAAEEKMFKIKQEPAWSEEDKKRISRIADFIWKNRKGDTDEIYQQEQDVNWLKSIKPRWKPTEEQMEALKYFISFHEDHARSLTTKWEEFKNLESLYNDLLKSFL